MLTDMLTVAPSSAASAAATVAATAAAAAGEGAWQSTATVAATAAAAAGEGAWQSMSSVEARQQQAQAELLTLLVADNSTGYFGVLHRPGRPKPYQAQVWRGGKTVHLGSFATAEEAALCVARTPEGKAAAEQAAPAPPLTSAEARQQAQAEELTLVVAESKTGYFGVVLDSRPGLAKPYHARVKRGGKKVHLGSFATAEEAALCIARSPEGQAAAGRAAAAQSHALAAEHAAPAPPLTSEEARQQAQAEELTLAVAESETGYYGVRLANPGRLKPYQARMSFSGRMVHLGFFATAEEAALCIARSPEGQAVAAERAAAAPALTSEEARQQARAEELTLRLAETQTGYLGVSLPKPGQPKPYQARVKRGSKRVYLGNFATAEEAALCVARSSVGQAARYRAGRARGERSSPSTTFWSKLSGVYSVVSKE